MTVSEIKRRLTELLQRVNPGLNQSDFEKSSVNIVKDLGFKSDEGLNFALEIEDEFQVSLPDGMNPFVNDAGNKGRTVSELSDIINSYMENSHRTK